MPRYTRPFCPLDIEEPPISLDDVVQLLLLMLCLAWPIQSILAALQVRRFARPFGRRRRQSYLDHHPPAAVIVPFKGREAALEKNLQGLLTQDYPDYRLLLLVESESDPAHPVLQRELARYPDARAELLVTGVAPSHRGQKVHNQIVALEHLQARQYGEQVWVFADSDAVPGPDWLSRMVGPLCRDDIGATTGYRWLVPADDDDDAPTLWARLASVMNSSSACFLTHRRLIQAWGGSMAIRVDVAREADLLNRLEGCLTDDYTLTRAVRETGRKIYFVPGCLVATPVNFRFRELANFAQRQYLLTRVYVPWVYAGGLAVASLYLLGLVGTWLALVLAWLVPAYAPPWFVPVAALAIVFLANQARAGYRRRLIRRALGEEMLQRLEPTLKLDRWATPVWMALHWALMLQGLAGRTMNWRGIRYHLAGPQQTRRLA